MRIRFETSMEDYLAFHRFHYANSRAWQRQRMLYTWLMPALISAASLFLFMNSVDQFGEDWFAWRLYGVLLILSTAVVSILWLFLIRRFMTANLLANARKLLAEGTNRTLLGWRELEIADGRLSVMAELVHSVYDLRAIEKIVGNEEYTFIYVSAVNAIFIPMQRYPEEEYRQFVSQLREAWEQREAPRPTDDARPVTPDERIVEKR